MQDRNHSLRSAARALTRRARLPSAPVKHAYRYPQQKRRYHNASAMSKLLPGGGANATLRHVKCSTRLKTVIFPAVQPFDTAIKRLLRFPFPQQITHLTLHPGGVIETPHLAGRPDDTRRAGIRTDSYSANACCASPSQRSSALPSVTASSSAIQAPRAIYCATGCAASPAN